MKKQNVDNDTKGKDPTPVLLRSMKTPAVGDPLPKERVLYFIEAVDRFYLWRLECQVGDRS